MKRNKKGAIAPYIAMFAFFVAVAAYILFIRDTSTLKLYDIETQGRIVMFASDVKMNLKTFDEGFKLISQRAAYDLGKNGGLKYETLWTETYPTIDVLKDELINKIKSNLPSSYEQGEIEITWGETELDIEDYDKVDCGALQPTHCYFSSTGNIDFSYTSNEITSTYSEEHELDFRIDSSYFKLLYAGREILENQDYRDLLVHSLDLEIALNNDPNFNDLDFVVNPVGNILEITIIDSCLDYDTSCLVPLYPYEQGITDWENNPIPYDKLSLKFTVEVEQEESSSPIFDYGLYIFPEQGIMDFVDCQFHMFCDHENQQCVMAQGSGASECLEWKDCIGGCRPDIVIDKTATAIPGNYPNCINKATVNLNVRGIGCEEIITYPIDVVLIIDRSGSMDDEIDDAKTAAKTFVDLLNSDEDRSALVSFSSSATRDQGLVYTKWRVKNAIDALSAGGGTDIGAAIERANIELDVFGRADVPLIEILLTDGQSNEQDALNSATRAKNLGITIYTIGLGSGVKTSLLQDIAEMTGGRYYFAPTSSDLQDIYVEISEEIFNIAVTDVKISDFIPYYGNYETGTINVIDDRGGDTSGLCNYNSDTEAIECSIDTVYIDQIYDISFNVELNEPGDVLTNIYPDSSVNYVHHAEFENTKIFPKTYVHVDGLCADTINPETTIKCDDEECFTNCWYVKDVDISFDCWDGSSGCGNTYFCVHQGEECIPNIAYTGPFKIETYGENYIVYYSEDGVGNQEQQRTEKIYVDTEEKVIESFVFVKNRGNEQLLELVDLQISSIVPQGPFNVELTPLTVLPSSSTTSSALLRVTASDMIPGASYTITVRGVSQDTGLTRTDNFILSVPASSEMIYSIRTEPTQDQMRAGESIAIDVNTYFLSGSRIMTSLSATSNTPELSFYFQKDNLLPPESTILTIQASNNIAPGDYTITVSATADQRVETATFILTILP